MKESTVKFVFLVEWSRNRLNDYDDDGDGDSDSDGDGDGNSDHDKIFISVVTH